MSRTRNAPRPARPKPKTKRYKGTKTLFRELSDCRIYVVDGTTMRREVDDNFIMGSNAKANAEYIPDGEIWIEQMLTPAERFFIALHETVEFRHMEKGAKYDQAHQLASKMEQGLRKKWKDFPFLSDDWPVSPDLPAFFPKR
ncbi:MAG: hypothetical protein JF616_20035 [Fibrobacteres bacterium]|nr:hypothetical protein [Fibrobacterota bacterium]